MDRKLKAEHFDVGCFKTEEITTLNVGNFKRIIAEHGLTYLIEFLQVRS